MEPGPFSVSFPSGSEQSAPKPTNDLWCILMWKPCSAVIALLQTFWDDQITKFCETKNVVLGLVPRLSSGHTGMVFLRKEFVLHVHRNGNSRANGSIFGAIHENGNGNSGMGMEMAYCMCTCKNVLFLCRNMQWQMNSEQSLLTTDWLMINNDR